MKEDLDLYAEGSVIDGKYRVERTIGEGGMGVVVEATHLGSGQRFAVKVLRPERADDEARERFLREGRIAAALTNEHVARVLEVGLSAKGEHYMVMELLRGHDLEAEILRRRKLPIVEAIGIVLEGCEGLAEAHVAGLVHRDVKPANLFLVGRPSGRPFVKLLDFGMTKVSGDLGLSLTRTGSTFGTPQYMAPEQVRSAKDVDARCDQHAMAMVLYELVSGMPAFDAPDLAALLVVLLTKEPKPLRMLVPEAPDGLGLVLARALAKEPGQRFPNLAAFAAAVGAYGDEAAAHSVARIASTFERARVASSTASRVAADPQAVRAPMEDPVTNALSEEALAALYKGPPPSPASAIPQASTSAMAHALPPEEALETMETTVMRPHVATSPPARSPAAPVAQSSRGGVLLAAIVVVAVAVVVLLGALFALSKGADAEPAEPHSSEPAP